MRILFLIMASGAFATGGLCMKYSQGLSNIIPSVGVFLLFGIGAAFQARAMARTEMSVAYVFVLGLEAVMASLLSVVVLHERMNSMRALAIVVIVVGIGLLQRS